MWTELDRVKALAWQAEQATACPGCGQSSSETLDPDAEDTYDARVLVCHACKARDETSRKWAGSRAGMFVVVERRR